jgi:hypothetical protein
MDEDGLLKLLRRFEAEGVQYVLVGGHAVRLNGFVRATEDIDILLPSSIENGRRVIRALDFLPSSADLDPQWFEVPADGPENIRVADDLLIDLLFAANGQTYESLKDHVRMVTVQDVQVRTLDIEGLLLTKTSYRDKDRIDREVLERLQHPIRVLQSLRMKLVPVRSGAVTKMGFDPDSRMLAVQFTGSNIVYGYPRLSDDEVRELLRVMKEHASLGHYIATVIKVNHDHERVQLEPVP